MEHAQSTTHLYGWGYTWTDPWPCTGRYLMALLHGDLEPITAAGHQKCVENVRDFTSAFLFSLETQHTIGWALSRPAIFSLASLGFELKFCDTFEQSQILSYFATIILLHTDRPTIMRRGKRLFKCLNMFLKIYEIEFKNSNFRSVSTCLRNYVQSCYKASGFP